MASLVVVLPADPVTPISGFPHKRRTALASVCSAMRVSSTDEERRSHRIARNLILADNGSYCAVLQRLFDEIMPVHALAFHREKELRRAGWSANQWNIPAAMRLVIKLRLWQRETQQLARAKASCILSGTGTRRITIVSRIPQDSDAHLHIIEGNRSVHARPVLSHVLYQRAEQCLPAQAFANRDIDRRLTVRFHLVLRTRALQAHHRIINDCQWILAARIVRSQHHKITAAARASPISGRLARSRSPPQPKTVITRPFGPACFTNSRAKRRQVAQRIISVSIVHDHRERLAAIHALEAARNAGQILLSRLRLLPACIRVHRRQPRAARMLYTFTRPISGEEIGIVLIRSDQIEIVFLAA